MSQIITIILGKSEKLPDGWSEWIYPDIRISAMKYLALFIYHIITQKRSKSNALFAILVINKIRLIRLSNMEI